MMARFAVALSVCCFFLGSDAVQNAAMTAKRAAQGKQDPWDPWAPTATAVADTPIDEQLNQTKGNIEWFEGLEMSLQANMLKHLSEEILPAMRAMNEDITAFDGAAKLMSWDWLKEFDDQNYAANAGMRDFLKYVSLADKWTGMLMPNVFAQNEAVKMARMLTDTMEMMEASKTFKNYDLTKESRWKITQDHLNWLNDAIKDSSKEVFLERVELWGDAMRKIARSSDVSVPTTMDDIAEFEEIASNLYPHVLKGAKQFHKDFQEAFNGLELTKEKQAQF